MKNTDARINNSFYGNPVFWAVTLLFGLILVGLYYSSLEWLILTDWVKDDYSHCILIPLITAYLLWEKKYILSEYISSPSLWGGIPLFIAICLYWLGELGGEYFTLYMSLWLCVFSLCILCMGWLKTKVIIFPVLFSLSMFPFPDIVNNRITLQLKLISTKIGVEFMQLYGMSAYREGNIIDLGFTKLQVVDACSGLRYLFPMIVLSILIAYYYRASFWKRAIIVVSSVPLTILSNSLRIALTGILSEKFGSVVIEGFFHDFEGIVIFLFTLIVLLFEIWLLKTIFPQKETDVDFEKPDQEEHPSESKILGWRIFKKPQLIFAFLFLLLNLLVSYGFEFREEQLLNKNFKDFPMQIGSWQGRIQEMEQKFIDTLDFTDYIMADYSDASGKSVNFYVAYYASQRKGESIHSPATCLRGGGWQFKKAGNSGLKLRDGSLLPVNRAVIEKKPYQQISYYWFPSRDRVLTNAFQMKWYNFWDAMTRQRTDGALVRVITLVYQDETVEDAEKRIQAFINDVQPVLTTFLPQ